jgi:polysaccharide export outer membrane protein
MKSVIGGLLAGLMMVLVAACSSSAPMTAVQAPAAAPQDVEVNYQLGTGDKVLVTVFGHDDLTGEYALDGAGEISMPLIGTIQARGLTSSQLGDQIVQSYSNGYLNAPQITVEVLQYRPYYILGEVNSPGSYPFTNGLTVLNAVATAQGFTSRADVRRVFVKRAGEAGEAVVALEGATPVFPGDTIRIPERRF